MICIIATKGNSYEKSICRRWLDWQESIFYDSVHLREIEFQIRQLYIKYFDAMIRYFDNDNKLENPVNFIYMARKARLRFGQIGLNSDLANFIRENVPALIEVYVNSSNADELDSLYPRADDLKFMIQKYINVSRTIDQTRVTQQNEEELLKSLTAVEQWNNNFYCFRLDRLMTDRTRACWKLFMQIISIAILIAYNFYPKFQLPIFWAGICLLVIWAIIDFNFTRTDNYRGFKKWLAEKLGYKPILLYSSYPIMGADHLKIILR